MRPVNLLPPEERRGASGPSRTGIAPYILVGALVLALGLVTLLVTTNNAVGEREDEIATLEAREANAQARAEALAPYAEFAAVKASREATVSSLAQSRFDWSRVMNELGLVTPSDVWLTGLTGSASGAAAVEGDTTNPLRASIAGPALEMAGCAASQRTVAAYISDLELIDGVTRVAVDTTSKPSSSGSVESAESGGSGGCAADPTATAFTAVVAFDAAPVPPTELTDPTATATPEASPAEGETTEAAPTEAEPVSGEAAP